MTVSEKQTIVYQALVEYRKFKEIAKIHQVTINTVSALVSKAKKKPNFISELLDKRDLKEKRFEEVKSVMEELTDRNEFIDSCDSVMKKVNEKS